MEDINISDIVSPINPLRSNINGIDELAKSIEKIGLLQPIVIRTNSSDNFEIVAGNRRLNAYKKLGRRKITCHVVELDDKTAFEVSIVENVQSCSLNPVEEGLAFRKYVDEFGWGGISELAQKLSKSTSYVCKRMKLVDLPNDILDLISNSEINVSTIEELLPIGDKHTQSRLTELIKDRQLSSRMVRDIVKRTKKMDKGSFNNLPGRSDYERIQSSFDKAIIAIRILIKKLVTIIQNVEDKWIFYDILMQHKLMLNQQIDLLIREKRKYKKRSLHLLSLSLT